MNLSKFFVDRPIFAGVLSVLIFVAGLLALLLLTHAALLLLVPAPAAPVVGRVARLCVTPDPPAHKTFHMYTVTL